MTTLHRMPGSSHLGPISEMLAAAQALATERRLQRLQRVRESQSVAPRRAPKKFFLAELEVTGDVAAACTTAGCSLLEVRQWRQDPMFERDFTLALIAHVENLKRLVAEIARSRSDPESARSAQRLLLAQSEYVDGDGRLNVRPWRDALLAFVSARGLDAGTWEPEELDAVAS